MKTLKNLGKALNKEAQKEITGGAPCPQGTFLCMNDGEIRREVVCCSFLA